MSESSWLEEREWWFYDANTLPKHLREEMRNALEKQGFKFFELVGQDSAFYRVVMPEGWKKEKVCCMRDLYLNDALGRRRAYIGWQSSFIREGDFVSADMLCRFQVITDSRFPEGLSKHLQSPNSAYTRLIRAEIQDTAVRMGTRIGSGGVIGKVIHEERVWNHEMGPATTWTRDPRDVVTQAACKWLDEHYPEWQNPEAYWDDEPTNHTELQQVPA